MKECASRKVIVLSQDCPLKFKKNAKFQAQEFSTSLELRERERERERERDLTTWDKWKPMLWFLPLSASGETKPPSKPPLCGGN